MVIWMMPWWDSLVIGGSGSLVFGTSLVRVEMEQLDTGGVHWRVFSEVVWSNAFSMDEAMNLWTFTGRISIQQHWSPWKVYDSRISRCLAARWSVCLGHPVSCGCGRWGSHATFPSHAWNVLWSGRVWCFLSVLVGTGVCRITAPQVMRCVSWEGSTRRIELTQQTPKISSQSLLQGISFFEICSCTFLFSTSPTQRTLSLSAWWLSWPCQMRLGFCLDLADLIRYRRHAMPINSNRPQTIKLYTRNFGRNLYPHFTAVKWTSPTYKQIYVFSSPRVFPVQKVSLHATHSTSFQVDRLWSADQCAEHLGEHSSLGWAGGDGGYL